MTFVNRERELSELEAWWQRPEGRIGLVWGRRRVGKTALLQRFAEGRPAVFHTATGRPASDELRTLSMSAARQVEARAGGFTFPITFPVEMPRFRDLADRPFADWIDALETFAAAGVRGPFLLVIDEFPELVRVDPSLPSTLRAVWDRIRGTTQLRILLCGSAVRTMQAIQEERSPLYGRLDLSLLLHPFKPHEAALMLPRLSPSDRAVVWGLVGGTPLYLEWWDQSKTIRENLLELVARPAGRLLIEGQNVLATEAEAGDLRRQVLYAIARGRNRYEEIKTAVRAEPARTLDRLVELGLVDRLLPVTEDPHRTRRSSYRIADNFLAFFLTVLDPYRAEIERGLGKTILPALMESLDDHLGPRWEEAFRLHLRRMAEAGALGDGIVGIGPFWTTRGAAPVEIDAVALAGRGRRAVLVGEAKWARRVNGDRVMRELERKASAVPNVARDLRFAIAAREEVRGAGFISVTAADIFGSVANS